MAGPILGDPIIPAMDSPPIIKAPNRNNGIPKTKQMIPVTLLILTLCQSHAPLSTAALVPSKHPKIR